MTRVYLTNETITVKESLTDIRSEFELSSSGIIKLKQLSQTTHSGALKESKILISKYQFIKALPV